jgi:hypothetical protein
MNKSDKHLMEKYDITSSSKTVFFYKEFKYDKLDSAVRYAEHEAKNASRNASDASGVKSF